MKKIFLFTLLSVFLLSAYSQITDGNAEIITKINITKEIDDKEIDPDTQFGFWIFFYRTVVTKPTEGGVTVTCSGWGWKMCIPRFKELVTSNHLFLLRGISVETVENSCENLVEECENRISRGEYQGSLTKKIALSDPLSGNKTSFLILQMNWNNDPKKPYNGTAEIIISKINDFGIKF